MDILALLWSPESVSLEMLPEAGYEARWSATVPAAIGVHRYDLALYGGPEPTIRLPGGSRSPFLRSWDGGRTFERLDAIPGDGSLPPNGCRAHRNGTLTAIDGRVLWVRPPSPDLWLRYELPEELTAHDVSIDPQGRIHVVGALPSTRLPGAESEAAYAVVEGGGTSFMRIALTDPDTRLLEDSGGAEAFRQVDAEETPILVTSDCAWLFEDPSSFALLAAHPHWTVRQLAGQSIRGWRRQGSASVSVFTSEGRRYRTYDGGVSWDEQDLLPAMRAAWSELPIRSPMVMAVAASGGHLALAVSSYDWRAAADRQLIGSAALSSSDDGETFEVRAAVQEPAAEILGILVLERFTKENGENR